MAIGGMTLFPVQDILKYVSGLLSPHHLACLDSTAYATNAAKMLKLEMAVL